MNLSELQRSLIAKHEESATTYSEIVARRMVAQRYDEGHRHFIVQDLHEVASSLEPEPQEKTT